MGHFWRNSGIALAGVATSIATAVIVTLINTQTGFNVFTFSLWVVLPVGAGICGFVAASGYYFGARILHQRPSRGLLFQMVVIAALTQILIYWLEYTGTIVNGIVVSERISFLEYLDITLTSSHLKIGRAIQHDTGEVGSFGYWLALFDFIGFLLGGGVLYLLLASHPACGQCSKYMKKLVKKTDKFEDSEDFAGYYDGEFINPVDTRDFVNHVGKRYSIKKPAQGTVQLVATVMACPECGDQAVVERVQVLGPSDWKDINELTRRTNIPSGIDVSPVYRSGEMARTMDQVKAAG